STEEVVIAGEIDGDLLRRLSGRLTRSSEPNRVIELLRLPRAQSVLDLFWIFRRIGGSLERFVGENRGSLVMLATATTGWREAGDDIRTNRPDQPHVVAENFVTPPLLERFLDAEGESEVDGAREVLLGAVEAMDRCELLGSQHPERFENLR